VTRASDDRLRAAVVGAGPVGAIHARALAADPVVELVSVCGRTASKTQGLADLLGVAARTSVDEMLELDVPDLVCICTGNKDHVGPSMAALEAGASVFVEKPLAFTVNEARAVVELARTRGVPLGVDFNHRFSPAYRRARSFVDAGGIGEPAYLSMKMSGDLYKDLNDPYAMLVETQGHCLDMLRHFGGEIAAISAHLADPRTVGVFTSASIGVEFDSGAVGCILGSWDGSYAHPQAQMFEFSGTRGAVVVENIVEAVRQFRHGEEEFTEWRPGLFDNDGRGFWRTIDAHLGEFVRAVLRGRPPPVGGEDGLRALELTYAAIRAFEERRTVDVRPD
jgi:predicted dehydrogenase